MRQLLTGCTGRKPMGGDCNERYRLVALTSSLERE